MRDEAQRLVEKNLKYLRKGFGNRREFVEHIALTTIYDSVHTWSDLDLYEALPGDLQEEFRLWLKEKSSDGYFWRPLMIGGGFTEEQLRHISQRLREIDKSIESSQ